jgi:6-phosphofructokinase 1
MDSAILRVDGRITQVDRTTSERGILQTHLNEGKEFPTEIQLVKGRSEFSNRVSEEKLGVFRAASSRMAVVADIELHSAFQKRRLTIPSFLEAGPRAVLRYDPVEVRAAIVTTGGLAPGLHSVIHSIVKRHSNTYFLGKAHGRIFGVYDSFRGLCNLAGNLVALSPEMTEDWLEHGGCKLGNIRYYHEGKTGPEAIDAMVEVISRNLRHNNIDILYVIGGDGSLKVAHKIALSNPTRSVVGIPKTMDNDVLWVWQSFGFDTAVEQATRIINTLCAEAESTRRICVVELFGAESGFVAANATLASAHVDLVLIPEVFKSFDERQAVNYLDACVNWLAHSVQDTPHAPHAVVVVAEGVGTVFAEREWTINKKVVKKNTFLEQLMQLIRSKVVDAHGREMLVFSNQPKHEIRAVPANAHEQIYCERLGALAVDSALGGYTDFMVSQWLTEFVLVPLSLIDGQKSIPTTGMFWKQVVCTTGQPISPPDLPATPAQCVELLKTPG